jgi:uncharacterized zinc-type alcohol dehydrogenase-like protein
MFKCSGYAVDEPQAALAPFSFERRDPGPSDVVIKILFCGVCHSDLHVARNEWGKTTYPCVPGHEIVGEVIAVGQAVKKFKAGDLAGVGCLVDSDRTCPHCRAGLQQFCESGSVPTYNGRDKHNGKQTFGGYSSHIVVDQDFTLRIPPNLPLAGVAPLLCAGITNYSAMRHWDVQPDDKIGVIGLGGLGHVAVKIARAMGAHVTVLTTSAGKIEDAFRLGANDVVVTTDPAALAPLANKLDLVIDTISTDHDVAMYLDTLGLDGTYVQVGIPEKPLSVPAFSVIARRRNFTGARIGGLPETQEMLDFCAEHNIVADIELISPAEINSAYERMVRNDVKYRFVIDMASLHEPG